MSENMRRLLDRKLKDPKWLDKADRVYDNIVNGGTRQDIPLSIRPREVFEPASIKMPSQGPLVDFRDFVLPDFDEPATIDEIWMDRWQCSSGGYTLTRTLDDTIQLDYPEGERFVYSIALNDLGGGYYWISEEQRPGGKRLKTYRTTDLFDSYDQALFDMHRAAMAEFDELTNFI